MTERFCVLQVVNFGGAAGLKGEKGDRVSMKARSLVPRHVCFGALILLWSNTM